MIIEYKNGECITTNDDVAHKIADAYYYLTIAMATGNTRRKKYWLKRIKELEARLNARKEENK